MVSASDDVVAIVPARGGSKSIPRKNVRAFHGHPLLAWSIAAARESRSVSRVIVSTDDEAIRDLALSLGAEAPFLRPTALAEDETPDLPVFVHALEWLARHEAWRPSIVVQLRPTSPVRPRGLVDDALDSLRADPAAHSLRAVTPAGQNPYKMWRMARDATLAPLLQHEHAEPFNLPRQQLPETYWQTGQIDVIRRATLFEMGSMTGTRIRPLVVEPRFAVDLDTPDQWVLGEWIAARHASEIVTPPRRQSLGRYRLLALDFDGVLTDNRVIVDERGVESVRCDRGDGLGLAALRDAGFPIVVLSTETNPVVAARCRKLGLPWAQSLGDKAAALREAAAQHGVSLEQVIYVGNDENDRGALAIAGLSVVPSDAHPSVRHDAAWVLSHAGGAGAVRELCDALLEARSAWPQSAERSASVPDASVIGIPPTSSPRSASTTTAMSRSPGN